MPLLYNCQGLGISHSLNESCLFVCSFVFMSFFNDYLLPVESSSRELDCFVFIETHGLEC